jgi:hypothetical protein
MYLGGCFFRQKTLMVPWFERHERGFKARHVAEVETGPLSKTWGQRQHWDLTSVKAYHHFWLVV